MTFKSRPALLLGLLLTLVLGTVAAFTVAGQTDPIRSAGPGSSAADAARTSFPGLGAAEGEPDLAGIHTSRPANGQVLQVQGPFDDRLSFENLSFDGTSLRGAVRITSDVSDLLELQVLAGFHDERGNLLGTARFVHHLGEAGHDHTGPPTEVEEFTIAVPAELQQAVSASVGVPVLVNE